MVSVEDEGGLFDGPGMEEMSKDDKPDPAIEVCLTIHDIVDGREPRLNKVLEVAEAEPAMSEPAANSSDEEL